MTPHHLDDLARRPLSDDRKLARLGALALFAAISFLGPFGCATSPDARPEQAEHTERTETKPAKTWSKDDFDIFVEVTADEVLVNGAPVAAHDALDFDESVERSGAGGMWVEALAGRVSAAAKEAKEEDGASKSPSLAISVDSVVSARVFAAVIYSAPTNASRASYALIVGDAPPVDVAVPDMGKLTEEEKLDAPPMLTLSPTWQVMRVAAFMQVARLDACVEADNCGAREQTRRQWVDQARALAGQGRPQGARKHLRDFAGSYDLEHAHTSLREAAARAKDLNGRAPHYLHVNLSGDLPAGLYPELFALRCENWSPELVDSARESGRWACEEMVDTIVVNIVR